MTTMKMTGERSSTLIAAIFDSAGSAGRIADELRKRLEPWQVNVVQPHDPALSRKLEPEQRGIFRTMKRVHVVFGVGGAVLGLILGGALTLSGAPAFVSTPLMTTGACALFGLFGGLLLGGLLGMRPDHDIVTARVTEAVESDHWAVVAHPTSEAQASAIQTALKDAGGEVVRSI